ncbi:hypothetical protein QCE63_32300 [Caballeronia sp. LZ065]|uniref:hypothetical protein n=1 Tax=Caballeronia sp. LZ065 TaxID=3038571 RepID=UPI00285A9AD3|nr:hypothetical protein [Caballeronia sp. LZ065]MDR5784104.1 hypothetical protein [Caballeronia sp. LZ065]
MNAPTTQRELQLLLDGGFDPVAYWADKPFKKWVVDVGFWNGSRWKGETVLVRASSRDGAERTAIANVRRAKSAKAHARLATPRDLGCVPA